MAQREGFLFPFFVVGNIPCGLDIEAFVAFVDNKVHFVSLAATLAFNGRKHFDNAHVYRIVAPDKFIVDDIFHQMRIFVLSEVQSRIPDAGVDCISAAGLFKGATREPHVALLLHSANVRVNEVRLLSFLGDVEIVSSGASALPISKTPSITAAKATERKEDFLVVVCSRSCRMGHSTTTTSNYNSLPLFDFDSQLRLLLPLRRVWADGVHLHLTYTFTYTCNLPPS